MTPIPFKRLTKPLILLIFIAILISTMVWLWQRQPKVPLSELQSSPATGEAAAVKVEEELEIIPGDSQVLTTGKVEFKGKYLPNLLLVIYSNNFQAIVKTDDRGEFAKEVELAQGLNQITAAVLDANLQTAEQKFLTLWVTDDDEGNTVFTGSVKSIFDTLITVLTPNGDRNIRTGTSTTIDIPKEENQAANTSAVKNIRIGDFAIGLGDATDRDTILAKTLTIERVNKPQNTKQFIASRTITNVRQNLFSAKDNQDGKIIELTLGKTSQIAIGENQGKSADITKDKTALVFYHPEKNQNIVDLVYLLL